MKRLLINVLAFQIGWFSCVIGAANGYPSVGLVVTMLVVLLHLVLAYQPRTELVLIAIAGVIGACFDSLLLQTGWVSYPNGILLAGIAPYWIVAMWVLFATTLNVSMRWLHGNYTAAALLGLIGGPLSYLGGARLGGLVFVEATSALVALAIGWAVMMPMLVWVSKRHDGMRIHDAVVQHA